MVERSIEGRITFQKAVTGSITAARTITGTLSHESIDGALLPWYDGDYTVIPTARGLTLATAKKSMHEDVDVKPIPIGFVSNDAGGRTASIG